MISMPVSNQVVRDPKEPGREGQTAIFVGIELPQRPVEGACRQIFSILRIAHSMIDVGIDAIDVALIEDAKGRRILARLLHQGGLLTDLHCMSDGIADFARLRSISSNRLY